MKSCHHSNSRHVHCACGHRFMWMRNVRFMACIKCKRVHQRGPDGPKKSVKSCEGLDDKITFAQAARLAQVEFDRAMYQLGFEVIPDKKNIINLTCHNTPRSKTTGFSVSMRTRYKGSETSL